MSLWRAQWEMWKRSHWLLFLIMLALAAVGALFIRSACAARAEPALQTLYRKQVLWACAGLALYLALGAFDYRRLAGGVWLYYLSGLALLAMTLAFGQTMYGSRRWMNFFGMTLQTSEPVKLAVILAAAWFLSRPGTDPGRWRALAAAAALMLAPMALIVKQPDLGTALVFVPIVAGILFVAGLPWRRAALLLAAGLVVCLYFFGALLGPRLAGMDEAGQQRVFRAMTGLKEYQWKRMRVFVEPTADPAGAGYNSRQSAIAVGAGGWHGKGYMQGTQSALGYLPRTVAPTDFIFSVIAEETGFVGSVTVLGLYAGLLACGLWVSFRARDKLGRLIGAGVTAMLFGHVFVNVAMTIGVLPVTGLPLPLVSYGGTFMLSTMAALGLLQSVYIRRR